MHRSMQILPIGYTTMIRLQKWSLDKKCLGKLQDVRLGKVADLEELDALQAYNSLGWKVRLVFSCQKSLVKVPKEFSRKRSHPILRCENLFPHLFFCYIFQTSIEAWDHPLSSNSSWRHAPAESGVLDMAQNFLLMKCISLRSSAIPLGISMFYLKANTVVVTQYFLVRSSHLKNAQDKDVHTHFRFLWETYKVGKPPRFWDCLRVIVKEMKTWDFGWINPSWIHSKLRMKLWGGVTATHQWLCQLPKLGSLVFGDLPTDAKNAKVILDVLKSNNRLEEAFVKTHQFFIPKMRPTFKRIIIWKWVEESEAEKIASLPGLSFILPLIWFFV